MNGNRDLTKFKNPLRCPKCGWVWDYQGNMTIKTNCPNCRNSVDIRNDKFV